MNFLTSAKATISSNLVYLGLFHSQDGTVEVDILPAGQFAVEAGSHFQ